MALSRAFDFESATRGDPVTSGNPMLSLRQAIARHFANPGSLDINEIHRIVRQLLDALNSGTMRAAQRDPEGRWVVDEHVKMGILLGFRAGRIVAIPASPFSFSDKDTFPLRQLDPVESNIRVVPGGSSVRDGCYLGTNVTCMPPAYINVGAFVDDDTLIDSHALVGSCAQVGKRVHLSAGVQIGGVLEPIGQVPVIIEDDVLVGGQAGIFEGTVVRSGAVIGAGTILTRSTPVYDLVRQEILSPREGQSLEIPERAVVVPGSRPASGGFAQLHHLHLATPVIVKYRDPGTDRRTALEDALR